MPVSAVPFISVDDLGDLLGEDLSGSDAAQIAVDAACDLCRTEADQTFNITTNDTITLDGSGTDALLLPELPVNGVDSVAVLDDTLTVDDDYVLNGQGILLRTPPGKWLRGRQNVTVVYDHGYADADFPRDVRVVALRVAARIFKQPTSAGIASETLGSYSVSYVTSQASQQDVFTAGEKAVLRRYKRSRSF